MAFSDWLDLIAVGVGSSAAGAGVSAVFGRQKIRSEVQAKVAEAKRTEAETADVIADTALKLLEPLNIQISALTERVGALESEVYRLEAENRELRKHIDILEG